MVLILKDFLPNIFKTQKKVKCAIVNSIWKQRVFQLIISNFGIGKFMRNDIK